MQTYKSPLKERIASSASLEQSFTFTCKNFLLGHKNPYVASSSLSASLLVLDYLMMGSTRPSSMPRQERQTWLGSVWSIDRTSRRRAEHEAGSRRGGEVAKGAWSRSGAKICCWRRPVLSTPPLFMYQRRWSWRPGRERRKATIGRPGQERRKATIRRPGPLAGTPGPQCVAEGGLE